MDAKRPDKLSEIDKAAEAAVAAEFEGEIREFVRRDISVWRKPQRDQAGADAAVGSIDSLIQRVSGASVDEIDRVISELQKLRGSLCAEGDRIRREITGYAGMSQSAMTSLKIMADSLSQFAPTSVAQMSVAQAAPAPQIKKDAG